MMTFVHTFNYTTNYHSKVKNHPSLFGNGWMLADEFHHLVKNRLPALPNTIGC